MYPAVDTSTYRQYQYVKMSISVRYLNVKLINILGSIHKCTRPFSGTYFHLHTGWHDRFAARRTVGPLPTFSGHKTRRENTEKYVKNYEDKRETASDGSGVSLNKKYLKNHLCFWTNTVLDWWCLAGTGVNSMQCSVMGSSIPGRYL